MVVRSLQRTISFFKQVVGCDLEPGSAGLTRLAVEVCRLSAQRCVIWSYEFGDDSGTGAGNATPDLCEL